LTGRHEDCVSNSLLIAELALQFETARPGSGNSFA
jgi:hypothetical protein